MGRGLLQRAPAIPFERGRTNNMPEKAAPFHERALDVSYRYNVTTAVLVENFDEKRSGAEVQRAARVTSDAAGTRCRSIVL